MLENHVKQKKNYYKSERIYCIKVEKEHKRVQIDMDMKKSIRLIILTIKESEEIFNRMKNKKMIEVKVVADH